MDLSKWAHPTWEKLDSTKLNTFERCPREYLYQHLLGWRTADTNIHLNTGIGIHLALDYLNSSAKTEEDVAHAYQLYFEQHRKHFDPEMDDTLGGKSPRNVQRALEQYAHLYKDEKWETLHTEVPTCVLVGDDMLHCSIDQVVRATQPLFGIPSLRGKLFVVDHKTTSMDTLPWRESWKLRFQIGAYIHALCAAFDPEEVGGAVINVLILRTGDMRKPVIDKDTGEQAVYKVGPNKGQPRFQEGRGKGNDFVRVLVPKNGPTLHMWLGQAYDLFLSLREEMEALADCNAGQPWLEAFPPRTSNCVRYQRLCPYYELCLSEANPIRYCEQVGPEGAPNGFEKVFWDPEQHKEVT